MKKKHNAIEQFCKATLAKVPNSYEMANQYRKSRVAEDRSWPEWCDLPRNVINKIYNHDYRNMDKGIYLARIHINEKSIHELAAALSWTRYKTICRFDEELSALLARQALDGDIPLQLLSFLPYPCMFVECNTQIGDKKSIGFFTWLEVAFDKGRKLQMLHLFDNGQTKQFSLILGGNLETAMQLTYWETTSSQKLRSNTVSMLLSDDLEESVSTSLDVEIPEIDSIEKANLSGWLNHLLYLCSEKPDMADIETLKKRRTYDSAGAVKRVATVDVGTRVGAAIRKAKQSQNRRNSIGMKYKNEGFQKSMAPHIRRAHWHRYWVGPRDGKRKMILRWIPPTAINIEDDKEFSSVIRDVK